MAYYAGKNGYLTLTPSTGALVRLPLEEWGLELETDEVELTNFESIGQKTIVGGLRGGTVSGSGMLESVVVGTVMTDFQANSGKIITLDLGFLVTGAISITVKAVLTGLTFGMNVKEKATFEFKATLTNMKADGTIDETQNATLAIA